MSSVSERTNNGIMLVAETNDKWVRISWHTLHTLQVIGLGWVLTYRIVRTFYGIAH